MQYLTSDDQAADRLAHALSRHRQGKMQDALDSYRQVLAADPNNFEALHGIGILYGQMGNFTEGWGFIAAACAVQPNNFAAHFNRGKALQELKRHEEALASYDRAIALKPDFAQGYNNRANVLKDLRRYDEALVSYDRAIALQANYAKAHNNRGAILVLLQRYDEALASYDKALSLEPGNADTYNNRGSALEQLGRLDQALASYDKALSLNPGYAKAYNNRGIVLIQLKQHEEALADFDKVIALDPKFPYLLGNRLYAQLSACDWDNLAPQVDAIVHSLEQNVPASQPFPLLAVTTRPGILRKCAELYVADRHPAARHAFWNGECYHHERIRIGYLSADLHNHATAYLMAELFEKHDRSRFEIVAYSFGPPYHGEMRQRLVNAFDRFFDVAKESNPAIASLVREHEIDIAVDLKGFTQACRPGVFALRPAPLQVNYLGFPGTMGASYIDYIIADPMVIPREHFGHYSEKVVHLPHSYQVNDSQRPIADFVPTRRELGIPDRGFVFCCFNNNFKITPDVFAIWMRLLARVEDSVLWLLEGNPAIRRNLSREAQRRGIDPARLMFAPRTALAEHLARHHRADLFLDTFHYNAHTTASDALWMGLPVLTCLGNTFAGRVAASLLWASNMPELITHNHEEYEAMALRLASHPEMLAALKRKILEQRPIQPLFNTGLFARHIEAAYAAMHQRHRQRLAPEHISISP